VLTWTVRDPFPAVLIPREEGVQEVSLDLGRVFDRTFATGAFERLMNYAGEPDPPLAAEDAACAEDLLGGTGRKDPS